MPNPTMMQFFHWYYSFKDTLWLKVIDQSAYLSKLGITWLWLPPATKGTNGGYSVGYDIYDLYDLGEFDQKGTIRTKYGTKEEYLRAIRNAHDNNMGVLADAVLNHRAGADELERFMVRKVNPANRNEFISDPFEVEAWTKFTYPGRKGKYSEYEWNFRSFAGIDWAQDIGEHGVFRIQNGYGDGWQDVLENELGNYDYLMFDDVEFRNPAVREELKRWGEWYLKETGVDGFRLDALKHIPSNFFNEWIDYLKSASKKELFFVGEYWNIHSAITLKRYIDATGGRIQLFDAPLLHNFYDASKLGRDFDMRNIFNNTLMQEFPLLSVTIVQNHDTQPLQSLETAVDNWFRGIAYALILLREQGIPCVFYPDLYGANYKDKGHDGNDYEITISPVANLKTLLLVRKYLAYGKQRDYIDHGNCIGWTREGDDGATTTGCAVVLSNGDDGTKVMEVGNRFAGRQFVDILKKRDHKVTINKDGWAEFSCAARSVSVWVPENVIDDLVE